MSTEHHEATPVNASEHSVSESFTRRFARLFEGLDCGYGKYNALQPPDEKGKIVGKNRGWVAQPLTLENYRQHLAGEFGLGVAPIRADSTCVFGAIDIDVYDGLDHLELIRKLKESQIPLIVCRSKSGGAHIYAFASEPVPAAKMSAKLKEIGRILGYGGTETFPKQTQIIEHEDGKLTASWVNLPYYGPLTNLRYALNDVGDPYELEEFLDLAERRRQPLGWFEKPLPERASELPQGPPCLQHLVQIGFAEGIRNNGLTALAVYYKKADPDSWKERVNQANDKYMKPPLPPEEVKNTIKSAGRKEYSYKCNDIPLCQHCNKELCRTREYGVGFKRSRGKQSHADLLLALAADFEFFQRRSTE